MCLTLKKSQFARQNETDVPETRPYFNGAKMEKAATKVISDNRVKPHIKGQLQLIEIYLWLIDSFLAVCVLKLYCFLFLMT